MLEALQRWWAERRANQCITADFCGNCFGCIYSVAETGSTWCGDDPISFARIKRSDWEDTVSRARQFEIDTKVWNNTPFEQRRHIRSPDYPHTNDYGCDFDYETGMYYCRGCEQVKGEK